MQNLKIKSNFIFYKVRYLSIMRYLLIILVISSVQAQDVKADELARFSLKAENFWGVDAYENLYYSSDNIFYKRNKGNKTHSFQYKDFNLGNLTSVDLIDPLRILLFYQDSNTVILLDNRLNEINRLAFNEIQPLRTITHAKLAGNRHLWLFNVDTQRLEVFDYTDLETTSRSLPVNDTARQLQTNFRKAWLVLPDSINIYDWYANKVKRLEVSFEIISIREGSIMARSADGNYYFRNEGNELMKVDKIKEEPHSFYLTDQKLYIYDQNEVIVYKITSKP